MALTDIANLATSIAAIVAVLALAYQFHLNRKSSEFDSFTVLLNDYRRVVGERRARWKLIREELKGAPKTAHEVHDRQHILGYLELRSGQNEPLFPVEHELLDREVLSLSLLNELCRLSIANERCRQLLEISESSEISYYKIHKDTLLRILESERRGRKFPKPRFDAIDRFDVGSWFDE